MNLSECAVSIIRAHKDMGDGFGVEQAERLLRPFFEDITVASRNACESLHGLWKEEADWRFGLADGVTVRVNFSSPPRKEHLAGFVKVFQAMAESFVEDIPA